jgi:2-keto-4-pentenoate hydratase/2-oxohepta-3-ene-1,7-dioic acid hydratase in catechol pathway
MRLATIVEDGRPSVAVVREGRLLPLAMPDVAFRSVRGIAGSGADGLVRVREWVARQPDAAYRPLDGVALGPAVPDPGAIFTIGLNYGTPGQTGDGAPERPLVYGKLPTSVVGHRATLAWDRSLTPNVDAEVELGVVIGTEALAVAPENAMEHVFGYTCINDVSSRDPWLDGDQWLLGKSMAGFCPVGPWVVTRDEIEPEDLRLGCTINGIPIQAGTTAQMRFSIAEVISYLSRHVALRPGDLIATGTPSRLPGPLGPERHLGPGDEVAVWIERIGELTTRIA